MNSSLISPYLSLVLKLWEYSFVFPQFIYHSGEKTYKYKGSFRRYIFSLFIITLCVTGIRLSNDFGQGNLLPFLNQTYYIILTIQLFVSFFTTYRHHHSIENILEKIIGFQHDLKSSNIDRRSKLYGLGLVWGLLQTVNGVFLYTINMYLWKRTTLSTWTLLLLAEILQLIDIHVYTFYSTLKFIMMGFGRNLNRHLSSVKTYENIAQFFELYRAINETNLKLSEVLSPIIFWKCFCECSVIAVGLFMILTNPYSDFKTSGNSTIDVLTNLYWLTLAILRLLFIISVEALIICESKLTAKLLQGIQERMGKHKLPYKSVPLFLLNTKLNRIKFTVYEFFEIDWKLIYSMVAGVTTYSIYLIQFREMEIQNSDLK